MNSNIALIALLLLLTYEGNINSTQLLLLFALLSTPNGNDNSSCNLVNGCGENSFNTANTTPRGRTTTTTCTSKTV